METGYLEFLRCHRGRAGSDPWRDALVEAPWSCTDGFAEHTSARGPTLTENGEFATGSIHVLDLPGPAGARAFAFDEPNHQAGGLPRRGAAPLEQPARPHDVAVPRRP